MNLSVEMIGLSPLSSPSQWGRESSVRGDSDCTDTAKSPSCGTLYFGFVAIGKSSVRKEDAGMPCLLKRFTDGQSAQP